ncbi:MAG: hypothetical protein R3D32_02360 [Nitratireductor sp.]
MVARARSVINDLNRPRNSPETGSLLAANPGYIRQVRSWQLNPATVVGIAPYLRSSLGLKFDLTAKENNDLSITPSLFPTSGSKVVNIGFSPFKSATDRQNKRSIDNVSTSLADFQFVPCKDDPPSSDGRLSDEESTSLQALERRDWLYPARGNIDLKKTTDAYFDYLMIDTDMHVLEGMIGKALVSAATTLSGSGPSANEVDEKLAYLNSCSQGEPTCDLNRDCYEQYMVLASDSYVSALFRKYKKDASSIKLTDTITFTTTLSAGLTPSITFSTGKPFSLKAATGGISGNRVDTHVLTFALNANVPKSPEKPTTTVPVGGNASYKLAVIVPAKKTSIEPPACPGYFRTAAWQRPDQVNISNPKPLRNSNSLAPETQPTPEDDAKRVRAIEQQILDSQIQTNSDRLQRLLDQVE